jgi:hypothetical protein
MNHLVVLLLPALLAIPEASTFAQNAGEQVQIRKDLRSGQILTLSQIEQRILPTMQGMEYIGPDYDKVAMAYRLKFIRNGTVIFVDVDARSGAILNRSH